MKAEVIADLGLRSRRGTDLQALLDDAVVAVARALDLDLCKVLELLPGQQALLLRAGVGWHAGLVGRGTVSAGQESQAGYTLLHDGPVVVQDLREDHRFDGPPLLHNHGVVSGLSTPIYAQGAPWGVLGAHARERRSYTQEDVCFLVAVANVLGAAVERAWYEGELREATARLREEDRLRARFLRSISHELRTPLTPLLLELEDLAAAAEEAEGDPASWAPERRERLRRSLAVASRSARRLRGLVDDLVDLSSLQVGGLALHMERVDLAALARKASGGRRAAAERRGLAVEERLEGPLPVDGDPERLLQMLDNLIANALRLTPAGGRVNLAARTDGDFALVEVTDAGPGLTSQQRHLLLEPYGQGPGDVAGRDGGLGLGLYIARGLADLHGGRMGVDSPGPGAGATFWVRLRLAPGHRLTDRVGR